MRDIDNLRRCQNPSLRKRLLVDLPGKHVGSYRSDSIENQQAVDVVDLVLQRAGLETFGRDRDSLAFRRSADNRQARGPADVGGQVRDAHATLPAYLETGRLDDHGIEESQ